MTTDSRTNEPTPEQVEAAAKLMWKERALGTTTPDYPWQGSRSSAFLQAADVVSPPVAAAVLGTIFETK